METTIRTLVFLAIFATVAVLEFTVPRRPRTVDWRRRWLINISVLAIDVLAQRLTLGAAAFATALYAEAHGWGLFGLLSWPWWIEAAIAFLVLDFAIYLQHVLSHALPVFWRLHRVHHADLDVDLTTGTRFHPLEILISLVYKAGLVAALGADPWTVLAFEAVLNGAAIFSHGNVGLPPCLDGPLRRIVVTPDMHRIHHSVIAAETNSNFGFFLSIWDRLCGTFVQSPAKGQDAMELGLPSLRQPAQVGLVRILLMPFRRQ
jgi:sterol desaturase/sphingolipid hydroxylase (fatty acid hydroxylase superfamily)